MNQRLVSRMTFSSTDEIVSLIKEGATPDAKNRHGLPVIFMATERGDVSIVKALIDAGADVNQAVGTSFNDDGMGYTGTMDGTPLSYAARKGHIAVMELLKKSGANLNGLGPEGTSPLMSAAESFQLESIEWLLRNGSTAGKSKALGFTKLMVNPNEKTKKIMQLLK